MNKIGVILPTADNIFFAKFAYEVEKRMKEHGYLAFIASAQNKASNEKEYIKEMQTFCKGILDISSLNHVDDGLIQEGYPFVFVDRRPKSSQKIACCFNDDKAACKKAVELLLESGCRKIVLLPGYDALGQTGPRVLGYKNALEENNISVQEEYIIMRSGILNSEIETEERIEKLLYNGEKIDGIIASSDRAAFGAMTALEKVGYYVPEDVRLITFDNSPYTTMSSPSITALDRNTEKMAQIACDQLLAQIEEKPFKLEEIVDITLIRRDSTR